VLKISRVGISVNKNSGANAFVARATNMRIANNKRPSRRMRRRTWGIFNRFGTLFALGLCMKTTPSSSNSSAITTGTDAMISYNLNYRDFSFSFADFNAPKRRYAWLEKEGSMWHFLTNLFADPAKSTRRWSNKQRALQELTREGWTVLYPYPESNSMQGRTRNSACGYGLMWIDQ
jgi:hypothetical protein